MEESKYKIIYQDDIHRMKRIESEFYVIECWSDMGTLKRKGNYLSEEEETIGVHSSDKPGSNAHEVDDLIKLLQIYRQDRNNFRPQYIVEIRE